MHEEDKRTVEHAISWLTHSITTPPEHGTISVTVQFRAGRINIVETERKESHKPDRTPPPHPK